MINVGIDGACKGNPGPGGWGAAFFEGDTLMDSLYSGETDTTNNRMELQALISACAHIEDNGLLDDYNITIWTDSNYVLKGTTEWLRGWFQKDFKGVKNDDLWRQVASYRDIWQKCTFKWVKGHSGQLYNETADQLANKGYKETLYENDGW